MGLWVDIERKRNKWGAEKASIVETSCAHRRSVGTMISVEQECGLHFEAFLGHNTNGGHGGQHFVRTSIREAKHGRLPQCFVSISKALEPSRLGDGSVREGLSICVAETLLSILRENLMRSLFAAAVVAALAPGTGCHALIKMNLDVNVNINATCTSPLSFCCCSPSDVPSLIARLQFLMPCEITCETAVLYPWISASFLVHMCYHILHRKKKKREENKIWTRRVCTVQYRVSFEAARACIKVFCEVARL